MLDHPALLVIDMQRGFLEEGGAYDRAGIPIAALRSAVPGIRELRDAFRTRGLPVLYTRFVYRADGSDSPHRVHRLLPDAYRGRSEPLFVDGTPDSEILPELTPAPGETVIAKNRYSAFFRTDLEERLAREGVRTLVLSGVLSHVCVSATAEDAFSRDFDVVVVRDAVAGTDPGVHEAVLRNLARTAGVVEPMAWVVARLPGEPAVTPPRAPSRSRPGTHR